MLNQYLQQVMSFTNDRTQRLLNPADLIVFINRARREVAMRTQSIRRLTPISGGLTQVTVTAPGSGYTAPTVTISAPDQPSGALPFPSGAQATATATVVGGKINDIQLSYGGAGYFTPAVTITDPTGTGAAATATVANLNQLNTNQEVYNFADFPLQQFPGVDTAFAVKSVSIIYANYRYSLPFYSFSIYQAMIRQYPRQYYYVPTMGSQYGQGVDGSLYLYPIASQPYQCEVDALCLPLDLNTEQDFEALPRPWTDVVPYFAAHLAYLEIQNLNAAQFYLQLFDSMTHRYSAYVRPGRSSNIYGRW